MAELTTGTAKLLQEKHNRQKFKEALQFVGRNDLAVTLEKIPEAGKSLSSDRFDQQREEPE